MKLTDTLPPIQKYDFQKSIQERFERVVQCYGDKIAVISDDGNVTFNELNRLSDHIAKAILREEIPLDVPIALLLGPTAYRLATILGVLKSGRFYIPLDITYPIERNRLLIEDSGACLLLTDRSSLPIATNIVNNRIAMVNVSDIPKNEEESNISIANSPHDIAIIIYTSGSTGRPKGVVHSHRNVLHNAMRMSDTLGITVTDKVLQLSPMGFIASLSETMVALLNGATSIPFSFREQGLHLLAEKIRSEQVTIYNSAPSIFRNLFTLPADKRTFSSIRAVRLGGEVVRTQDSELCQKFCAPGCILQIAYGSTETGLISTFNINSENQLSINGIVGYPVSGMSVRVEPINREGMDDKLTSDIGQIIVKSRYLTLGYWKRDALIKSSFKNGKEGDIREFQTGDMGRILPNGIIEHLGRSDRQIKIGGSRVDCSEVEAALLKIPEVDNAIVIPCCDQKNNNYLAAYLVVNEHILVKRNYIRSILSQSLPQSYIPRYIEILDQFPLTPNGKINLSGLPVPQLATSAVLKNGASTAQLSHTERLIADIWCDVLGVEFVGINENFFECGGDSLAAYELFLMIEQRLGRRFDFNQLLHYPTIAEQAVLMDRSTSVTQHDNIVVKLQSGHPNQNPLFCIPGVMGHAWLFRHLLKHLSSELPIYAFNYPGIAYNTVPLQSVEEMAELFYEKMRSVQKHGPYRIGGYSYGGLIAYELAIMLAEDNEQVKLLVQLDSYAPGFYVGEKYSAIQPQNHRSVLEQQLLRVRDCTREAANKYNEKYYSGNMILFYTTSRPSWVKGLSGDVTHGWGGLVKLGVKCYQIDCTHLSLLKEPAVAQMGAILQELLDDS